MELCKYCKESEAIKNSHIIPSFIYEWVKKHHQQGTFGPLTSQILESKMV